MQCHFSARCVPTRDATILVGFRACGTASHPPPHHAFLPSRTAPTTRTYTVQDATCNSCETRMGKIGGVVCRWRRLPFAARHAANGWMVYRDRGGTFRVRRGVAVFLCRWMVVLVGSSSRCAAVRPDRSSEFSSTSGGLSGRVRATVVQVRRWLVLAGCAWWTTLLLVAV